VLGPALALGFFLAPAGTAGVSLLLRRSATGEPADARSWAGSQIGPMTKRIDYLFFCLGLAAGVVLVTEARRVLAR
jgi:hypothetical protein